MEFRFVATVIGSLPHKDISSALDLLFSTIKDAPAWPQLPKKSFLENMYAQFSENMPGIFVDEKEAKIFFDTDGSFLSQFERTYEKILSNDLEFFKISRRYASGLYGFVDRLKKTDTLPPFIKGQVTGPVSFALTVCEKDGKPSFYNETLKEIIPDILGMKAKWMEKFLQSNFPDTKTIIFFDEPYLVSIGSGYMTLSSEEVKDMLKKSLLYLSGIKGIHCCGNTDWGLLFDLPLDIISFDAYNFSQSVSLYPDAVSSFLERGGTIAFGIVPNNEEILNLTIDDLKKKMDSVFSLFEERGIDKEVIFNHSMITPSCGLGSASLEVAKRCYEYTSQLCSFLK